MDSEGKKGVNPDGGNVSQDDIRKFEEFLKENILKMGGGGFFESSVTELNKRFLELIFKMPIFSLLDKLEVREICPDVLKVYLEKNQKNIRSLLRNKNFLDSLINAYIDNMVSLFGIIEDTQKKSKAVQQSGMINFELIKQNVNAENHEHDNALDVMEKQQTYLSNEFDVVNTLWTMISNSSQVNDAHIAVLDVISKLFAETYKNTRIFQYLVARQLDLTQQANENAREANRRADAAAEEARKLQSEKNEIAEQLSKAQTDVAVERTNVNNLNQQLKTEKERANKLQEENKQLLEAQTDAAAATAKVGELKETIKAKDETVEAQRQSIEMQKQSIADQRAEIEKLIQENEKNRQENIQKQQQLDKRESDLIEKERKVKELQELLEKKQAEIEKQNKILKIQRNAIKAADN